MEVHPRPNNVVQHLAGIVPIAGQPLEFNFPWHDSLLPIAPDYLAIERAVFQCALAGCETIWIVGHYGMQPLIRKRVGDAILDPLSVSTNPAIRETERYISIYYIPIHPRDRDKRDCLGWSVLFGADSAYRISNFLSKWVTPQKFFCSFPHGVASDNDIHNKRTDFSTATNVIFSHEGKTVKDNIHAPFTFGAEDFFKARDIVKFKRGENWGNMSAKYYDLATVFKPLDLNTSQVVDLEYFHDVSTWEGYRKLLSSGMTFKKPKKFFKGRR